MTSSSAVFPTGVFIIIPIQAQKYVYTVTTSSGAVFPAGTYIYLWL